MKTKLSIIGFIVSAFSIVLLSSCNDHDNVINNNNNGQVLFTKDSISLIINPPGGQTGSDSSVFSTNTGSASTLKLEFQIVTNSDSTHAYSSFYILSNSPTSLPPEQYIYTPAANTYSYLIDVSQVQNLNVIYHLGLVTYTTTIPYSIKFANIKISVQQ